MRKTKGKIALTSFLVVLFTLVCAVFLVACNKEESVKKYTVTWVLDSHVSAVEITDGPKYSEKMEVAKGTKISFKLTFEDGWAAGSVRAGKSTVRATNGVYTTGDISENMEISVVSAEQLDHITAELADEDAVFYAGDVIKADDVVVTAYYKTGRNEAVVGTVSYQQENADALSLGDTKFYVSYPGADKVEVEFDAAVKGLITLNLNGGKLSAEDLALLPSHKVVTEDSVSWTFEEPFADDFELPEPTLIFDEEDPDTEMPFVRWSGTGVAENKIAAETDTSIIAGAVYYITLVDIEDVHFALENEEGVNVPYLVYSGTLTTPLDVYLFYCEGNAHIMYNPEITIDNSGTGNSFEVKLDLAKLAAATPVHFGDDEHEEDLPTNFIGPWLDLRFCADYNGSTIMQEIFLTGEDDYVDLFDKVIAKVGENWYMFSYKTWGPEAGDEITGGNGALFEGGEQILKLYISNAPDNVVNSAELEDGGDVAYLVLNGQYVNKDGSATKESVEEVLEALTSTDLGGNDCSIEGFNFWDRAETNRTYDVNEDLTWTIKFTLDGTQNGHSYYVHFLGENLSASVVESSIKVGNMRYTIEIDKGTGSWTAGLVWVTVKDESLAEATTTNVTFEVGQLNETEVAFLVFSGTVTFPAGHEYNQEADIETLKALFNEYSVQEDIGYSYLNGASDGNKKAENTVFEIDEHGAFKVKIALNGASDDTYWYVHYNGDVFASDYEMSFDDTVTANGQTFSFFDVRDGGYPEGHQSWLAWRLIVHVTAVAAAE